jgi:hypothetical protein
VQKNQLLADCRTKTDQIDAARKAFDKLCRSTSFKACVGNAEIDEQILAIEAQFDESKAKLGAFSKQLRERSLADLGDTFNVVAKSIEDPSVSLSGQELAVQSLRLSVTRVKVDKKEKSKQDNATAAGANNELWNKMLGRGFPSSFASKLKKALAPDFDGGLASVGPDVANHHTELKNATKPIIMHTITASLIDGFIGSNTERMETISSMFDEQVSLGKTSGTLVMPFLNKKLSTDGPVLNCCKAALWASVVLGDGKLELVDKMIGGPWITHLQLGSEAVGQQAIPLSGMPMIISPIQGSVWMLFKKR